MSSLSLINQPGNGNIVYSLVNDQGMSVAEFDWRVHPNQPIIVTLLDGILMFSSLRKHEISPALSMQAYLDEQRKLGKVEVIAKGIARWEVRGTSVLLWIDSVIFAVVCAAPVPCGAMMMRDINGNDVVNYMSILVDIPGYNKPWDKQFTPVIASYAENYSSFKF